MSKYHRAGTTDICKTSNSQGFIAATKMYKSLHVTEQHAWHLPVYRGVWWLKTAQVKGKIVLSNWGGKRDRNKERKAG